MNQSEKDFNGGRTKNDLSPPMLYFSTPNLVSVQLIRSFSVLRYFLGWRLVTCILFVCAEVRVQAFMMCVFMLDNTSENRPQVV